MNYEATELQRVEDKLALALSQRDRLAEALRTVMGELPEFDHWSTARGPHNSKRRMAILAEARARLAELEKP